MFSLDVLRVNVSKNPNPQIADTAQNSFSLVLFTLIEYCIVVNKIGLFFLIFAFIRGIK